MSTAPKIVFVSYGSFGDVNPLLAVARACARELPVAFVTNEHYREHVESRGVAFHAAGTPEEQAACNETAALSGKSMAGLMAQFRTHVGLNVARIAEYFTRLHAAGARPIVVTHGTINPAFPICEKLGLRVARAYLAPSHLPLHREDFILEQTFYGCAPWRARHVRYRRHALRTRLLGPPHARTEYNTVRAACGIGPSLPPWQSVVARALGRKPLALDVVAELLMTPRWFAEPLDASLERVHCVGFPVLEQSAPANAEEIEAFVARHGAPLVFTPGTGVEDMGDFCRPIESACHKLGAPGILLARHGAQIYTHMQRVLNHPVMHVEYADLAWLLPRARALVHTGGIGTIAQAVKAGIPQLIHPTFNDQPRNALRVLLNGLGGVLQGEGYSSSGIANLCRELEGGEVQQECLRFYGAAVRAEDGAQNAARVLLELLAAGATARSAPAAITSVARTALAETRPETP